MTIKAFKVFDIQQSGSPMEARTAMSRIAKVFDLDADALLREYEVVKPRAQFLFRKADTQRDAQKVNKEAWKASVEELKTLRRQSQRRVDVSSLRVALQVYFSCGMSTSGVEQRFSKADAAITAQHNFSVTAESMATKLLNDIALHPSTLLINGARTVWLDCFAPPRKAKKERADAGLPRKRKETDLPDEQTFLKRRRMSAATAAASSSGLNAPEPVVPASEEFGAMWGPQHDKLMVAVQKN